MIFQCTFIYFHRFRRFRRFLCIFLYFLIFSISAVWGHPLGSFRLLSKVWQVGFRPVDVKTQHALVLAPSSSSLCTAIEEYVGFFFLILEDIGNNENAWKYMQKYNKYQII